MSTQPRKSRLKRWIVMTILLAAVSWIGWRWATAPQPPNVRTDDLGTVIGYMGTEDFTRMYGQARADYATGVVDRIVGIALEKFYLRPAAQRAVVLKMIARAQQKTSISATPGAAFESQFKHIVTRQPPRVQGMMAQFVLDLARQREILQAS